MFSTKRLLFPGHCEPDDVFLYFVLEYATTDLYTLRRKMQAIRKKSLTQSTTDVSESTNNDVSEQQSTIDEKSDVIKEEQQSMDTSSTSTTKNVTISNLQIESNIVSNVMKQDDEIQVEQLNIQMKNEIQNGDNHNNNNVEKEKIELKSKFCFIHSDKIMFLNRFFFYKK